jgi:hypothetical protein
MHIVCQIQEVEITEILLLVEIKRGRVLHKSLELLLKKYEKDLLPKIDTIGSVGRNKGINRWLIS